MSTTLALRTTMFLSKEVEYMPWETANRNLNYFFLMFDRDEVYGPMQVCDEWSTFLILLQYINSKTDPPKMRYLLRNADWLIMEKSDRKS